MKHSKLFTVLGIAGALLVPALAVAELEDLNEFMKETPVSASAMNDNFDDIAAAIAALEASVDDVAASLSSLETSVETLENAGLQAPIELNTFSAPLTNLQLVYQVHTDGVMTVRPTGSGWASTTVRLDAGASSEQALACVNPDGPGCTLGRGNSGSSASVFMPAGYYVAVHVDQLENTARAKISWQPLHGPDPAGSEPTPISSNHP